jgi:hypothetical protein
MGIVSSKTIWKSHYSSMNDYMEASWILRLLEEKCREILKEDNSNSQLLSNFLNHFSINMKDYFLSCFSEDCDSLNQWRAYADDGKGIAIGFSSESFGVPFEVPLYSLAEPRQGLFRVFYNAEEQSKMADEIIRYIIQTKQYTNIGGIDQFCLSVKNPTFADEKEIRLAEIMDFRSTDNPDGVGLQTPHLGKHLLFRTTKYGDITPYREHHLNTIKPDYLKCIVLGPRCELNGDHLLLFLESHDINLKPEDIIFSKATYR